MDIAQSPAIPGGFGHPVLWLVVLLALVGLASGFVYLLASAQTIGEFRTGLGLGVRGLRGGLRELEVLGP